LEEGDEITDNDDGKKEDAPEETSNQEAKDPTEEDPVDWSEYLQEGSFDRAYVPQGEVREEFLEKVQVTRTTLAESLLEQLHFLSLSPEYMRIAEFLVGSLDERGYLSISLDDVAHATGRPVDEVERVVRVLHALE